MNYSASADRTLNIASGTGATGTLILRNGGQLLNYYTSNTSARDLIINIANGATASGKLIIGSDDLDAPAPAGLITGTGSNGGLGSATTNSSPITITTAAAGVGTSAILWFNYSDSSFNLTRGGTTTGAAIAVSGAVNILHDSAGTTTLRGDQAYTGSTTIHKGTLVFDSSGDKIAATGGDVILDAGATFLIRSTASDAWENSSSTNAGTTWNSGTIVIGTQNATSGIGSGGYAGYGNTFNYSTGIMRLGEWTRAGNITNEGSIFAASLDFGNAVGARTITNSGSFKLTGDWDSGNGSGTSTYTTIINDTLSIGGSFNTGDGTSNTVTVTNNLGATLTTGGTWSGDKPVNIENYGTILLGAQNATTGAGSNNISAAGGTTHNYSTGIIRAAS
jgi:hypothetical protein